MFERAMSMRNLVGLIFGIGAALLFINVLTDSRPSKAGDRFQQIDAYVNDQIDDSRIPGTALAVVEDGRIVHARGFGDDGRGNQVTPKTPFPIGSNTKSFTALAVMHLVEAGQVDLDAPVQHYLPDFRVSDAEASSRITVRHLLNQTSGLSRTDGLRIVAAAKGQTLAQAVADMNELDLNREVGESFQYSNLNSVVLGLIVQTVSGQSWSDYVRTHILRPLGMTRTYTSLDEAKSDGLTATHRYLFGFPFETEVKHLEGLAPSGYLYSSAEDMALYLTMYLQGGVLDGTRVLSEAGIEEMLTGATDQRTFALQSQQFTARYGAGWFVGEFGAADDARWHQGSLPNFTAWTVLLPDTNQAVVVLINAGNQFELAGANSAWSRIPQGVVNILRGEDPPTGLSVTRFFTVFDTLVMAVLAVQVWSLVRVSRRAVAPLTRHLESLRVLAPLLWEVGLAGFLLVVAYPALTGGLGWRATFSFIPDLTLVVVAVSALWLLTGAARIGRLTEAAFAGRERPRGSVGAEPTATRPTFQR